MHKRILTSSRTNAYPMRHDSKPHVFDESCPDGRYRLSVAQYTHFMSNRGMDMKCVNASGLILTNKLADTYLFFEDRPDGLRLLDGAMSRAQRHNFDWYCQHQRTYASELRHASVVYNATVGRVAREVRSFGGSGRRRGFIVDIDDEQYVSVNPMTSEIQAYRRRPGKKDASFASVERMLSNTAKNCDDVDKDWLVGGFLTEKNRHNLPILCGESTFNAEYDVAISYLQQRQRHRAYRFFDALLYFMDYGVIRIWLDDIFMPEDLI